MAFALAAGVRGCVRPGPAAFRRQESKQFLAWVRRGLMVSRMSAAADGEVPAGRAVIPKPEDLVYFKKQSTIYRDDEVVEAGSEETVVYRMQEFLDAYQQENMAIGSTHSNDVPAKTLVEEVMDDRIQMPLDDDTLKVGDQIGVPFLQPRIEKKDFTRAATYRITRISRQQKLAELTKQPFEFPDDEKIRTSFTLDSIHDPTPPEVRPGDKRIVLATGFFEQLAAELPKVPGVTRAERGYAQGTSVCPQLREVVEGRYGHALATAVYFNPEILSLDGILEMFWTGVGITGAMASNKRAFCFGRAFRSGIYVDTEEDKAVALATKEKREKLWKQPVVTEVEHLTRFFVAEKMSQDTMEQLVPTDRWGL